MAGSSNHLHVEKRFCTDEDGVSTTEAMSMVGTGKLVVPPQEVRRAADVVNAASSGDRA